MREIDLNEQFIVYVIFNGSGKWYISDKDIWYLDYNKWIDAYRKVGYEINREYLDERRRDLLCLDGKSVVHFLKRMEADECSSQDLQELFFANSGDTGYKPSLYVDFDSKVLYSMYMEPASYEDYAPSGWCAKYMNFLNLIPTNKRYWEKQSSMEG